MGHFSFSNLMFPQLYNNISSFNYTILISFTVSSVVLTFVWYYTQPADSSLSSLLARCISIILLN